MSDKRRPLGVLIGTVGSFLHSEEFHERNQANLEKIHQSLEIVKLRTCR